MQRDAKQLQSFKQKLLPVLSQAPQGSIPAFPPTLGWATVTPISSSTIWAGAGSAPGLPAAGSTFWHARALRQLRCTPHLGTQGRRWRVPARACYGIYAALRSHAMAVTSAQQRSALLRVGAGTGAEQKHLERMHGACSNSPAEEHCQWQDPAPFALACVLNPSSFQQHHQNTPGLGAVATRPSWKHAGRVATTSGCPVSPRDPAQGMLLGCPSTGRGHICHAWPAQLVVGGQAAIVPPDTFSLREQGIVWERGGVSAL